MDKKVLSINSKLENLKYRIQKDKKKFYHFRSISNFLYHINDKKLSNQNLVIGNLLELMDFLESNNIDSIHDSLTVFNRFLKPIGELYEKDLGFFIFMKPWILNIWISILLVFFYMIGNKIYLTIFLIALFIFFIYWGYKVYKRKVYAFMW